MSAAGTPAPNWGPACRTGWSPAGAWSRTRSRAARRSTGSTPGSARSRIPAWGSRTSNASSARSSSRTPPGPASRSTTPRCGRSCCCGPVRSPLATPVSARNSRGGCCDLAQRAHLAQPLIGEGRLRGPGDGPEGRPAAEVLAEHGIEPLELAPKEGLSLVNGTEPMQALLSFSVHEATLLVQAADVACALSVEALLGHARPYDERVQALRPQPGQLVSAANLRALLAGSALMASHRTSRHAVQDAYCLRCAPQVHGAVRDVLGFARGVLETELGSVVDNPVIAADGEVMISGNFHGEPLAFAADMLAMALSELASISERRVDRMLDPAFSRGLPPFLAPH